MSNKFVVTVLLYTFNAENLQVMELSERRRVTIPNKDNSKD